MKIEKINDNQIRCTLTRDDLAQRQLKLSELAYGSEKAKSLFREMMQQAASEFGFESDNLPLMIEAIPTAGDSIVLNITKVDDPDELDTRFSRFTPTPADEAADKHKSVLEHLKKLDGAEDFLDILRQMKEAVSQLPENPEALADTPVQEQAPASEAKEAAPAEPSVPPVRLFSFSRLDREIKAEDYLVPENKGEYLDMAFANVTSFLYVRSEPTKESEYVGKLYPGYAAKITGPVGEWTAVESGDVTGYVKTEYILTGAEAQTYAENLVTEAQQEGKEEAEAFTYAVSRKSEEAQMTQEVQENIQQMETTEVSAQPASNGQAIVDYACQFIGNPYVWGGTSLTDGADCSGFVQSVFAHFGISLPRTTYDQINAGVEVSYDQAMPGDLICYDGHIGIYIGNGQIVNAQNPEQGIGISPATYTTILSVRRIV